MRRPQFHDGSGKKRSVLFFFNVKQKAAPLVRVKARQPLTLAQTMSGSVHAAVGGDGVFVGFRLRLSEQIYSLKGASSEPRHGMWKNKGNDLSPLVTRSPIFKIKSLIYNIRCKLKNDNDENCALWWMQKQMQRLELDIKHSNTITGPKTKLKSCKFIPCKEVFKSQETAVCEEDCRVECSSGRPGEPINATHKQVNRQKWLKS